MSVHFYRSTSVNLNKLAESLTTYYEAEHFEVQHVVDQDHGLVQIKKTGVLRSVTGLGKALGIHMQQVQDGLRVKVTVEDWASKLTAGGIAGLLLPLITMAPAIYGSLDEVHLAHTILDKVDHLVLTQDPAAEIDRHHAEA